MSEMQKSVGVKRCSLLRTYTDNQVAYLQTQYPQVSKDKLEEFVINTVNSKINRPKLKIIHHPSVGNSEMRDVDLLTFIKEHSHRIITPSGTIYKSTDEEVAFDKQFIDMLRNKRDTSKKAMLKYAAEGKELEKNLEDFKQSLCKIQVNSIIGSNGNNQNAMYDLEAFNGVTSMARHGVIMAYSYVERFLTSNFYFPNLEHVINYIITTKKHCPSREVIYGLTEKYGLINPLPCEVTEMFCQSLKYYVSNVDACRIKINDILEHMPLHEVTFIYYSRNLYNLFTANTGFWKNWIHEFTHYLDHIHEFDVIFNVGVDDIKPTHLWKLDGDLRQVIATIYSKELKGIQIKKIPEENPELAIRLYLAGLDMQKQLNEISDLFDVFLYNDALIAHIHSQRNIIRKCVAISDTDSVIFTTKHLVQWYLNGDLNYSQDAYNINALIVYLLTKSIASIIQKMSVARGATGDNIEMIEMKNEYLYPVLIKTGLGKHYAGNITVQEGNFLPKPHLDIKGVSFMSSNVPKISHDFLESVIEKIQSDMVTHGNIYMSDYVMMAYDYEKSILKSLNAGEFTYFPNISIKNKEEYKKPESSIYVNYEFWEQVFAFKYGSINLPTKVPIIPIKPKAFQDPVYLGWLKSHSPEVFERLEKYLPKLGKKAITRIPLSVNLIVVPQEIVSIIQTRPIVYKNMAPVQLALRSIGIDLGSAKRQPLFSDYYSFDVVQ